MSRRKPNTAPRRSRWTGQRPRPALIFCSKIGSEQGGQPDFFGGEALLNFKLMRQVVAPSLEHLFERCTARPVVARVTVTKDASDILRTYEHLTGLGFFEVGFSPVTATIGPDYELASADLHEVLAGFRQLGSLYVERAGQGRYTDFSNLSTLLTDIHVGTNKFFPCGAGLGLLDVDGNGDVYRCHRFPGSEEHTYGNMKDGLDYGRLNAFVNKVHLGNKTVCQTCWVAGCVGAGVIMRP